MTPLRPVEIDRTTAHTLLEMVNTERADARPEETPTLDAIAADLALQLAHYCRGGNSYGGDCAYCATRADHENIRDRFRRDRFRPNPPTTDYYPPEGDEG